jgi:large subunit ribosomal protein L24
VPSPLRRNRPRWVSKEQRAEAELLRRRTFVPFRKWAIKVRDVVQVNGGAHRGLRGPVVARDEKFGTVQLDLSAHGHSAKQEMHYSRVALVDPATDKMTKVKWRYLEDGERVRIAKSGAVVPIVPHEPSDGVAPPKKFAPSATRAEDVLANTYVPLPDYSLRSARMEMRREQAAGGGGGEHGGDAEAGGDAGGAARS